MRRTAPSAMFFGVPAVLLAAATVYLGVRSAPLMNSPILTAGPAASPVETPDQPSSTPTYSSVEEFLAAQGEYILPPSAPAQQPGAPAAAADQVVLASGRLPSDVEVTPPGRSPRPVELIMSSRPAAAPQLRPADLGEATEVAIPIGDTVARVPAEPAVAMPDNVVGSATLAAIRSEIGSDPEPAGEEGAARRLDPDLLKAAGDAAFER